MQHSGFGGALKCGTGEGTATVAHPGCATHRCMAPDCHWSAEPLGITTVLTDSESVSTGSRRAARWLARPADW